MEDFRYKKKRDNIEGVPFNAIIPQWTQNPQMDARSIALCSMCVALLCWLYARILSRHTLLTCTIASTKYSIVDIHRHPHTHTKTRSLSHTSTQTHTLISISLITHDNKMFHACWQQHRLPYRHLTAKPMQSYTRSCSFPIQKKNTHRRTDAVGCITCTFNSMQM